jgi:hypothetical protein
MDVWVEDRAAKIGVSFFLLFSWGFRGGTRRDAFGVSCPDRVILHRPRHITTMSEYYNRDEGGDGEVE